MFQINCPNCGTRNISEFRFGGEVRKRPENTNDAQIWADYLYTRRNTLGKQIEWWYHRMGCRRWFLAHRHTMTNEIFETFRPNT